MAYHIGRILNRYFGLKVLIVGDRPKNMMFSYETQFPVVSRDTFVSQVTSEDLLVCNPSFSDQQFGLRLPCKKLSYVQNVRTFKVLDVFFDHYVFVSDWVRWYIENYYGIKGTVIPAFIHVDSFSCSNNWLERQASIPITCYKLDDLVLTRLRQVYSAKYPDCPLVFKTYPIMWQKEFANVLKNHRYYLSLAVMEGFGLPMLEAMAAGCAAVGWDAGGSSEYTKHSKNCMIARYGDIEALADHLHFVLANPCAAQEMAAAGQITGKQFDISRFDEAWKRELSTFLKQ